MTESASRKVDMSYPEHLLPSTEKDNIFSFCPNCLLCRWTQDMDAILDEEGDINLSEIREEIVTSFFSCNFIRCGTEHPLTSNVEDILLNVGNNELTHQFWTGVEKVPNSEDIVFSIEDGRGYFYLFIRDLDNYTDTFPKNVPHQKNPEFFELKLHVTHKPTMINFFHFQIAIFINGEEIFDISGKQKWRKEIRFKIYNLIELKAKLFRT